uniref:Uncharacterized protein n=1 Tax=Oryza glumipatula TaxID=40148 RepID=A0A0D9YLB0_9ORYZ
MEPKKDHLAWVCSLLVAANSKAGTREEGNLGEGELGILAEEAPELQLHPVPLVERGQVPSSVPTGARRRSEEAHPAGPGGTSAAEQYGARSCAGAREDAGRGGGGGEGFHGRSGGRPARSRWGLAGWERDPSLAGYVARYDRKMEMSTY